MKSANGDRRLRNIGAASPGESLSDAGGLPRQGLAGEDREAVAHLPVRDRISRGVRTAVDVGSPRAARASGMAAGSRRARSSAGVIDATTLSDAAPDVLPWDDPAYWEPVSDAAIEVAARAFRRHLAAEQAEPSPRPRSRTDRVARPA